MRYIFFWKLGKCHSCQMSSSAFVKVILYVNSEMPWGHEGVDLVLYVESIIMTLSNLFIISKRLFHKILEWFGWRPVCFIIMQMIIKDSSELYKLKQVLFLWEAATNEMQTCSFEGVTEKRLEKQGGKEAKVELLSHLHQVKCLNSWQSDCKWAPKSCDVTSLFSAHQNWPGVLPGDLLIMNMTVVEL